MAIKTGDIVTWSKKAADSKIKPLKEMVERCGAGPFKVTEVFKNKGLHREYRNACTIRYCDETEVFVRRGWVVLCDNLSE